MSEPVKEKCAKPPRPPQPNMKNKEFVAWTRTETCRPPADNLVSSDWLEKLQKTPLFTPVYDNAPTNMVLLLSGEYGRMWEKEREDWYAKVFVLNPKEKDMNERRKRIRKQAREAKKAAEISIQERKARRAKELEAKAKAEQEKAEKLKAKLAKCAEMKKKPKKAQGKADTQAQVSVPKEEPKSEGCPQGWTAVELTMQCECSHHKKDGENKDKTEGETKEGGHGEIAHGQQQKQQHQDHQPEPEKPSSPTMCEDYIKQLASIQEKKEQEATSGQQSSTPS